MKSFIEFLKETTIDEVSLERMLQHFNSDTPFVILTASRNLKEITKRKNEENNKKLRSVIKGTNFGYIKLEGYYPEDVDGEKVISHDDSTCVFGTKDTEKRLLHLTKELAKHYNQESILYKSSKDDVRIIYFDGRVDDILDKEFHPNKVSDYMSKVKGKPFTIGKVYEYEYEPAFNSLSARGRMLFIEKLDREETNLFIEED